MQAYRLNEIMAGGGMSIVATLTPVQTDHGSSVHQWYATSTTKGKKFQCQLLLSVQGHAVDGHHRRRKGSMSRRTRMGECRKADHSSEQERRHDVLV